MKHASKIIRILLIAVTAGLVVLGAAGSIRPAITTEDRILTYTAPIQFDFVGWTINAFKVKIDQAALDPQEYLTVSRQTELVHKTLDLVGQADQLKGQIEKIYADPGVKDPLQASADLRAQQKKINLQLDQYGPLAESILQTQVSSVLAQQGLTTGGQPIPPVLYHSTPLPYALIISPLDAIREDYDISLLPDLTLDQITAIEQKVEQELHVSALVVPVGGIGVYPTMVMRVTDLPWLAETVSHEWTHNYLTLRPLGMNYMTTPELRTMNETTASISGTEIGTEVLKQYYPDLAPAPAPPPAKPTTSPAKPAPSPQPPQFDFRKEMHDTRVKVDEMLKTGKIDEAGSYMEQRRQVFWQHGYLIRRLNQAYFAFYGAYADTPGGAAGSDPVGPAVRQLRAQSSSLADFINRIARMTSFEELQKAIQP